MSGESFVEEFEDLFLLLLIRVSTNSAIKYWKIAWLRRTDCPCRYSSASRMTNLVIVCSCLCVSLFLLTVTSFERKRPRRGLKTKRNLQLAQEKKISQFSCSKKYTARTMMCTYRP